MTGVRLLVLEDDVALRQLLQELLELQGATVLAADTGGEGLALARTHRFDLVLTDLGLPDIPGEEVITNIRAMSHDRTPIAVLSGSDSGRLSEALRVGAERVFTKPVDWDDLLSYVARRTGAAPAATTRTVLVVEDDQAMRAVLRDTLQRAGYRVIERAHGADLTALTAREGCDIVLLDHELPGPKGLDLLSTLHTTLPMVPVILVTAFGGPDVAREAARRGAYRYLEKPFRMGEMLEALAAIPPPDP